MPAETIAPEATPSIDQVDWSALEEGFETDTGKEVTAEELEEIGEIAVDSVFNPNHPTKQLEEEFPSVNARRPRKEYISHKIDWGSPEQEDFLAEQQESLEFIAKKAGGSIFGENTLKIVEALRDDWSSPEDITREFDRAKEVLKYAVSEEAEEGGGISSEARAKQIVEEAATAGLEIGEGATYVEKSRRLLESITEEQLEKFLQLHVGKAKEKKEKFEKGTEAHKENFVQKVREAVEEGRLPSNVDMAKIEARMAQMKIVGLDFLSADGPAFYQPESHSILVVAVDDIRETLTSIQDPDGESASLDHVFAHEAFHGEGGFTLVKNTEPEHPTVVVRSGLQFLRSEPIEVELEDGEKIKKSFYSKRFTWLTEAATEKSAMRVDGMEKSEVRSEERHLLDLLLTKGKVQIPEELVLQAYFEDYDSSKPYGERVPYWKKLRKAINDAYDPRFLIELDNLVDAYQNETIAITFLESLEPGSYGHQGSTLEGIREIKATQAGLDLKASWQEIAETE